MLRWLGTQQMGFGPRPSAFFWWLALAVAAVPLIVGVAGFWVRDALILGPGPPTPAVKLALRLEERGMGFLMLGSLLMQAQMWLCRLSIGAVREKGLSPRVPQAALALVAATLLSMIARPAIGRARREAAFRGIVERSVPLLRALHVYQAYHGEPARNLQDLVPEYLPEVPNTGVAGAWYYFYVTYPEHSPWRWTPEAGVPVPDWTLEPWLGGRDGANYGVIYWSTEQYPTRGPGTESWVPMGAWRYYP